MRAAPLLSALIGLAAIGCLPGLAAAAEDRMTAAEFDAYVTGKTLSYSQYGEIFGIEEYLPDRRVRWRVAGGNCEYGSWFERGDLICFRYEYDPQDHCWTFRMEAGRLTALSVDDPPGAELSEVEQTTDGLSCPGPDVGV